MGTKVDVIFRFHFTGIRLPIWGSKWTQKRRLVFIFYPFAICSINFMCVIVIWKSQSTYKNVSSSTNPQYFFELFWSIVRYCNIFIIWETRCKYYSYTCHYNYSSNYQESSFHFLNSLNANMDTHRAPICLSICEGWCKKYSLFFPRCYAAPNW